MRMHEAQAFWLRAPGGGEIRPVTLPEPGPDDVVVRTVRSGISRGTETLVFRGRVPPDQYAAMRAPFQEGDFPGPVKYGYLNVGVVEQGPAELRGRTVFCLYPHQTAYVVPAGAVTRRARGRAAGPRRSRGHGRDRGQRPVGRRTTARRPGRRRRRRHGRLLRRAPAEPLPGVQVTLVDVDPGRAEVAAALGVDFALPVDAAGGRDLVVHTSATSAGLQRSLELLAPEGTVHRPQLVRRQRGQALARRRVPLGPARDPRQPGRHRLPGPRRAPHDGRAAGARARAAARPRLRRAPHRASPASRELPDVMARLAAGTLPALCHTITYDGE